MPRFPVYARGVEVATPEDEQALLLDESADEAWLSRGRAETGLELAGLQAQGADASALVAALDAATKRWTGQAPTRRAGGLFAAWAQHARAGLEVEAAGARTEGKRAGREADLAGALAAHLEAARIGAFQAAQSRGDGGEDNRRDLPPPPVVPEPTDADEGNRWTKTDTETVPDSERIRYVGPRGAVVEESVTHDTDSGQPTKTYSLQLANGSEFRVETAGGVQRIWRGGKLVSETGWTRSGPKPLASAARQLYPLFSLDSEIDWQGPAALWNFFSEHDAERVPFVAFRTREYAQKSGSDTLEFVGELSRSEVQQVCRRYGDVQRILTQAARQVNLQYLGLSPQKRGIMIHKFAENIIRSENNPRFTAEIAPDRYESGQSTRQRYKGSTLLDVLELLDDGVTVCVYDHKTGKRVMRPKDFIRIQSAARRIYPESERVLATEMRP